MSFCRYKGKQRNSLGPGAGVFVRPMGGGLFCSCLHLSADALEAMGLKIGDVVELYFDEATREVGINKSPDNIGHAVQCYGCTGGGILTSMMFFYSRVPNDKQRRELRHDTATGLWAFKADL